MFAWIMFFFNVAHQHTNRVLPCTYTVEYAYNIGPTTTHNGRLRGESISSCKLDLPFFFVSISYNKNNNKFSYKLQAILIWWPIKQKKITQKTKFEVSLIPCSSITPLDCNHRFTNSHKTLQTFCIHATSAHRFDFAKYLFITVLFFYFFAMVIGNIMHNKILFWFCPTKKRKTTNWIKWKHTHFMKKRRDLFCL